MRLSVLENISQQTRRLCTDVLGCERGPLERLVRMETKKQECCQQGRTIRVVYYEVNTLLTLTHVIEISSGCEQETLQDAAKA